MRGYNCMTILIAHRGLLDGPNLVDENNPNIIEYAREKNYDVELDLRYINNEWWLGHDYPAYKIDLNWLLKINNFDNKLLIGNLWIHAKNIKTLYELKRINWAGHVFFHQNDDVTLTSTGYLWTYPGKLLTPFSICVMPEWTDLSNSITLNYNKIYGFCTDYINQVDKILINNSL